VLSDPKSPGGLGAAVKLTASAVPPAAHALIVGELTTFAPDMRGIWVRLTDKHAAHQQRRGPRAVAFRRARFAVPTGLKWRGAGHVSHAWRPQPSYTPIGYASVIVGQKRRNGLVADLVVVRPSGA